MHANILLWIAAGGYIVVQQFQPRPLNSRMLVGIPLALAFWGAGSLTHLGDVGSIAFFSLNAVVAAGLGVWRGSSVRVWNDGSRAFQQGTIATLGLWLVSIVVRLALVAVGHVGGLSMSESMAELPVLLGITLGAQNLVIWMRSAVPAPGLARSL